MARNRYYSSKHWKQLKAACHGRDGYRCTVAGCGSDVGLVCDHVQTRPNSDYPTFYDVLDNVRTLCGHHDRQVKERAGTRPGAPRRQPRIAGCDAAGVPLDPDHPWFGAVSSSSSRSGA